MGVLYILQSDVMVAKKGGTLQVKRQKEVLIERPLAHVTEVVILGNATVSAALVRSCMEQQTPIHYLSHNATYLAQIAPIENKNVLVRLKQYASHFNVEQKHQLARRFVEGKLNNAIVFARRAGADVSELLRLAPKISSCEDSEVLRGLEGNAAKQYFSLIKHKFPAEFAMEGRNKRPPRDPANSLLSLAYTFLAKECQNACRIAGLDPYVGFLHEAVYGRPALALDLMEEFRAILADSVVLTLFNKGMISLDMFDNSEGYPKLNDEGFKQFLRAWEKRLYQEVKHPYLQQKLNYRQIMVAQARLLGKFFMADIDEYPPFSVR